MARSFNGSTHKLTRADTCGISGYPVTFACWFNPANVTANHGLINFGNSTNNGWYLGLWADGSRAGDPINAVIVYGNARRSGNTSAFSASTWQHAAGVFTSTALQSWLNGVSGSASSHSFEWPSTNRTGVGVLERGSPVAFLNGSCAEAAIWNVALTDDEIKALAAGLSPLQVRPQSLVAYWPLFARATNEEDWVGGNTLTVTGATAADHPRIIYPAWPEIILSAAAAASGASGSASITESADSVAGSANIVVIGSAAITEAADTVTASGVAGSASVGSAAITEAADSAVGAGNIVVIGTAVITESADSVFASDGSIADAIMKIRMRARRTPMQTNN